MSQTEKSPKFNFDNKTILEVEMARALLMDLARKNPRNFGQLVAECIGQIDKNTAPKGILNSVGHSIIKNPDLFFGFGQSMVRQAIESVNNPGSIVYIDSYFLTAISDRQDDFVESGIVPTSIVYKLDENEMMISARHNNGVILEQPIPLKNLTTMSIFSALDVLIEMGSKQ